MTLILSRIVGIEELVFSCSCSCLCSGQVLSLTETCQNCYLKSRGCVPWYRSGDLDPSDLWDLDFDLDLQGPDIDP